VAKIPQCVIKIASGYEGSLQCPALMQKEEVSVMPSYGGGGNVVVA